ncbi:MAG: hypothetical protein HXS44_00495 [Theionarchaea archaeon]|nr:hypothetical protein [Theionarchaea archaeon]
MPENHDHYKSRIIHHVQRIDQARNELAESIKWAQHEVSPQFLKDASALVDLLPDLSYEGFMEYMREIPYYIKRTKEFIIKWDEKGSSLGYSDVLRCARKCGQELRSTQGALDETREVVSDITGSTWGKGLGISLLSVITLAGIVLFFTIVVILSLMG